MEEELRKKWRKKIAAGGRERDDVLSLNCFSGSAISIPLAAQLAEGVGERTISLRTLPKGFVVTRISHDQENHIGNIDIAFFNANECYDRAYIQVGGEGMYTVHAQVQWNQILFCLACNHKGLFCDLDVRRPAPFGAYPSKWKFPLRPLCDRKISRGTSRNAQKGTTTESAATSTTPSAVRKRREIRRREFGPRLSSSFLFTSCCTPR